MSRFYYVMGWALYAIAMLAMVTMDRGIAKDVLIARVAACGAFFVACAIYEAMKERAR